MKKVLLIDSYNMIHRARYGFNRGDNHITFGFFRCLKSEISRHKPDLVYLVLEGRPHHRYEIQSTYKANRVTKKDEEFDRQKKDIFKICEQLPVTMIRHPDFECDDVISMLCTKVHRRDEVTICSSDSDFIQLLELDNVSLWNPVKKKYIEKWPVDYCIWKSFKGDSADNIKGVKGVGDKNAMSLASDESLREDFFKKKPDLLKSFIDSMKLIKFAEINPNDPSIESRSYLFGENDLFKLFQEREFNSITGKSWKSWKETMGVLSESYESSISRSN